MNCKWLCLRALMVCACAGAAAGGGGWLGRVVQYRRDRFLADVNRVLPPVQITARIEPAPAGYVDAAGWDFAAAARLLALLRASRAARPVYRALRRSLQPSRRILLSKKDTYKYFPSIHEDNYYDDSYEFDDDAGGDDGPRPRPPKLDFDDNSVIIVSNPVEARLPSARISVKMLREIMEARAVAGRIMPSTPSSTIPWKTKESTTGPDKGNATTGAPTEDTGDANGTEDSATEGSATEDGATEGSATEGSATEGSATEGSATEGSATEGSATEGGATESKATEGEATEGGGEAEEAAPEAL